MQVVTEESSAIRLRDESNMYPVMVPLELLTELVVLQVFGLVSSPKVFSGASKVAAGPVVLGL